jgi:hypothetical protein
VLAQPEDRPGNPQGKIDRYPPTTVPSMPICIAKIIALCSSDKCAGELRATAYNRSLHKKPQRDDARKQKEHCGYQYCIMYRMIDAVMRCCHRASP